MPGMAQYPAGEQKLVAKIRDLERRIRTLETNNRNASSSIPATGSFAAGTTDLGTPIFEVGLMPFGDAGWVARDQTGQERIGCKRLSELDGRQRVFINDKLGHEIMGDDFLSLQGSGSVHHPLEWRTVASTNEVAVTSGTFVATWESDLYKWGVALDLSVWVRFSDTTTAAEVDVTDAITGNTLLGAFGAYGPVVVPAGSSAAQEIVIVDATGRQLYMPGDVRTPLRLQIRARRTSGAGTVNIRPGRAITNRT